MNLWLVAGVFEPVAPTADRVHYVLVSASFGTLLGFVAASAAGLAVLLVLSRHHHRAQALRVVLWSAVSIVPLLTLVSPFARELPALAYVLYDLRWFWWLLITAALLERLGLLARVAALRASGGAGRLFLMSSLLAVPVAFAVVFTPHLRFDTALHGDEPKYLRFAENFFQGIGFDISQKQTLIDREDDRPRVWRNVRLLFEAVPQEARLLVADARRALGLPASPRLLAGEPSELFFEGKHAGTVYQLHNPGLSVLLFPAYYLDRRVTGRGVGYQDEFPAEMPALQTMLLGLYAAYALALYALLRSVAAPRATAWVLAVLGVVMLPTGAFAFQIYPEVPSGIAITLLVRWLLLRASAPDGSSATAAVAYGALAGFLPWLHVRLLAVSAVATVWALGDPGRVRRDRVWFAAAAGTGLLMLSFYTYHLTGSVLPVATYGAEAPLSFTRVLHGVPAFAFDRVWGLFPHAPLYWLALPGVLLAWRRRPAAVWLTGLVLAAVIVPAAGHGFWAGGSTPGRYLVAVVPLLLVFVAEAWSRWSRHPWFQVTFILLAGLSLDTAISYNLHHLKHVGPLVVPGFSGWRPNLLFPSTGTDTWTATSTDVVLLALWILVALLLIALPLALRGRARTAEAKPVTPVHLRVVLGGMLLFALIAEVGVRATGNGRSGEYLMAAREARERALQKFAEMPRCAVCYFSGIGVSAPTAALGNRLGWVLLEFRDESPRAGHPVRFRVRPRTAEGEYIIASVRVDFGDGSAASYPRRFGDVDLEHLYPTPGEYTVHLLVEASDGDPVERRHVLTVLSP